MYQFDVLRQEIYNIESRLLNLISDGRRTIDEIGHVRLYMRTNIPTTVIPDDVEEAMQYIPDVLYGEQYSGNYKFDYMLIRDTNSDYWEAEVYCEDSSFKRITVDPDELHQEDADKAEYFIGTAELFNGKLIERKFYVQGEQEESVDSSTSFVGNMKELKKFATLLDGREIGYELSDTEKLVAMQEGFVVIYGASDDLCEMRGAYEEEFGVWDGGVIEFMNGHGKVRHDTAVSFEVDGGTIHQRKNKTDIAALWCPRGKDCSWAYETDIPHAEFRIFEDGELYCIGIVLDVRDLY